MKPGDSESVEQLFDEVAPKYDLLNDLLSLGLHRLWKKKLLEMVSPGDQEFWVDLCCGTGDLTISLSRLVGPKGRVFGIDSASEPLDIARKRSKKKQSLQIDWIKADVLQTEFPSNYFDGAVMAYGLRNLSDPFEGLVELRRILKPGSLAGVLDFNRLEEGSLAKKFQMFYLRNLVVPLAAQFQLRPHYSYLEESLKQFPFGFQQEQLALRAGFSSASHRPIAASQMGLLLLKA